MYSNFEEYAASSMLGQGDSPPRMDGKILFANEWERNVFGIAVHLSKSGYFEWEDFRQHLIQAIAEWEQKPCVGQPNWDYYQCFFVALSRTLKDANLLSPDEIAALGLPLLVDASQWSRA
ncbi:MAG TPA: nitrile hydratase accessory protein [Oxalicibacterium sp.]|uniref:nitrile hydratase accessory protein n=1 Tax=Oxalicibacterium sp. TaxID=2766525 RepID=UPI002BF920E4|nr:nitrile hydratase accessory protein [Oxalicibacterium sp.]HWU97600.1 nitrile hydratase accessory protein [Oxalicibacterium sp.]